MQNFYSALELRGQVRHLESWETRSNSGITLPYKDCMQIDKYKAKTGHSKYEEKYFHSSDHPKQISYPGVGKSFFAEHQSQPLEVFWKLNPLLTSNHYH